MADTPAQLLNKPAIPGEELPLKIASSDAWVRAVLDDFDSFLQDHAAAEKKASGMALSMIAHYPDRTALVEAMADLAIEEMNHYREVIRWLHRRGQQLAADTKDAYVIAMREQIRQGRDVYFLDRLLTSAIIEARGCERFGRIAAALPAGDPLQRFYESITRSEQRHYSDFIALAELYFAGDVVEQRAAQLLGIEADILQGLPVRAALH